MHVLALIAGMTMLRQAYGETGRCGKSCSRMWWFLYFSDGRWDIDAGWWLSHPPEKYESQIGSSSQLLGKI